MSTLTIPALVTLLKDASDAYYNGGELILSDEHFDTLLEQLRQRDPSNPFLKEVGAPPPDASLLPAIMPSLEKIKPGQDRLTRFLSAPGGFVISEKLDGLSALWCPARKALYLRGDGRHGQAISHCIPHIQGLRPSTEDHLIRGELLLRRTDTATGSVSRTIVNGLVHQKVPNPAELAKLRFVAYEVIQPSNYKRGEQFEWLMKQGYEVPWWSRRPTLTVDQLAEALKERRTVSQYDTDGIVVAVDRYPAFVEPSPEVRPPKDMVAFKMTIAEQTAETTVEDVLWAPSAQGYLIPRIKFKPVSIGGATIEFCTGHNARTVVQQRIAKGARITICRSGDVIPKLLNVITPALQGSLPPVGTWEWVGDTVTATHIRTTSETTEQVTATLQHFVKTLELPSIGPSNCKALVEAGITSPKPLWEASEARLGEILGPKTGKTVYNALRSALMSPKLTELQLMLASSKLPRGVGKSKLSALFEEYPDPRTWTTLRGVPKQGWTTESFTDFKSSFPSYETWRKAELGWLQYPIGTTLGNTVSQATPSTTLRYCCTGFRDASLEERGRAKGYQAVPAITQKVNVLVVASPDAMNKPSEKLKKAKGLGLEILTRDAFVAKYLDS